MIKANSPKENHKEPLDFELNDVTKKRSALSSTNIPPDDHSKDESEATPDSYLVAMDCPNCGRRLEFTAEGYSEYEGNCACGRWSLDITAKLK